MATYIESLQETYDVAALVVYAAFVLGILFGVIAEISRYCMRAAVAEWFSASGEERGKLKAGRDRTFQILSAIAVATFGTSLLALYGDLDFSETIYLSTPVRPLATLVGGLIFGVGMVLAGGCVSRLLVLGASGNMRSVVTLLVTGVAGYATLRGILALPRLAVEQTNDLQLGAGELISAIGISPQYLALAVGAISVLCALLIAKKLNSISVLAVISGSFVGLLIVGGWAVTGILGNDGFDPMQLSSFSFVAPVGESIQYLMIFTGDTLRFSIALVGGVIVGALISSIVFGRFSLKGFQTERSVVRYITGGIAMGFGGVLALGCTVGQGLSGVSTGSANSLLAVAAIVGGASIAFAWQNRTSHKSDGVAAGRKSTI